jgi:hypothetical protein
MLFQKEEQNMHHEKFHVRVNNRTGDVVPMWGHKELKIEINQKKSIVCRDTDTNNDVTVALHRGKLIKVTC